jgi:CO/xanthine dehydrogenase Mo-binding subunit
MKDISTSIPKVDNPEKLSGRALYVSDYEIPNLYYAKTLRSTQAKAFFHVIKPQLPQGIFIIDASHLPQKNVVKMIADDWKIFADVEVNYIGEPILLVIGQDKQKIEDVIHNIHVKYEPQTPIFDQSNIKTHKTFQKGNPQQSFQEADLMIEETFETGYQEQAYIEPQGMIAYPETADKITLIGSIQCPYYVKNAVVEALGYDEKNIRVIQPAVGGAFGGKEEFPSMMACQLAVAVHHLHVPIKMIYEREEDMISTTKRHPSHVTIQAAIKNKKITALKTHVAINGGAYLGLSNVVLSRAMLAATSAYTIENLDVTGDVYLTNSVPTGAFRGFGAPQMIFAVDMMMEHIAKKLKVNSLSFHRAHLAKQHDLTSTGGIFRDPIIMPKMIEKALDISDYINKRKIYDQPTSYKGIGMSLFLHGCGFTGSGEAEHIHAKVKLVKDEHDDVYIYVATVDMGQGQLTTLKKIVEHVIDREDIRIIYLPADTDDVPDSGPTVASRTTMIVGGLLARAALKLKETWKTHERMEIMESYVQPEYIRWNEEKLQGDAYPAYSWGVNVVEVEVNPITYQVDLKQLWSVYDIGHVIDERLARGQADGGLTQGVAFGYLEKMEIEQGRVIHKNFTDYIIPTAKDMAKTQTFFMDNPYAFGPYGAKGLGELSLVGGAPAVALAIEMAIQKSIHRIPVTPEMIMELIEHED